MIPGYDKAFWGIDSKDWSVVGPLRLEFVVQCEGRDLLYWCHDQPHGFRDLDLFTYETEAQARLAERRGVGY